MVKIVIQLAMELLETIWWWQLGSTIYIVFIVETIFAFYTVKIELQMANYGLNSQIIFERLAGG